MTDVACTCPRADPGALFPLYAAVVGPLTIEGLGTPLTQCPKDRSVWTSSHGLRAVCDWPTIELTGLADRFRELLKHQAKVEVQ